MEKIVAPTIEEINELCREIAEETLEMRNTMVLLKNNTKLTNPVKYS